MTTKEEDYIERVVSVASHDDLLMFTNKGKVYVRRAYQIPEFGRATKGTNIANVIETEPGESVTALVAVNGYDADKFLTMVTRRGTIKRTSLSEFEYQRKGGKRAILLDEDDELIFVGCTDGTNDIMIASVSGRAVRFSESRVRPQGRTSHGVRGIRLGAGERVVGVTIVDESKTLLTVTENGFGKRTEFSLFETKNRGGMGVCCHNVTAKTGDLIGLAAVSDDDDIMLITDSGIMIRTHSDEVRMCGRAASGVIIMRTGDSKVANFAVVAPEEGDDGEEQVEPESEGTEE